ncbi:hypothetical protein K0M31_015557 [Melipona bicolor]|uniref:Uncharacterized protein n=1 Tax=Melipona bicolor TaxID=60889 RepID=A0AA40KEZ8_9HYME|nr:hypothetical protein K0M31_015557 [Melipona bicolor]
MNSRVIPCAFFNIANNKLGHPPDLSQGQLSTGSRSQVRPRGNAVQWPDKRNAIRPMIFRVTSVPQRYPASKVYSEWNGVNTPGLKEEIFARQTERFSAGVELHAGIFCPLENKVMHRMIFTRRYNEASLPGGWGRGRLTRVTKLRFNEIKHRIGGALSPVGACVYSPRTPGRPACKNVFIEGTEARRYVLLFYAMEIRRME